MIAYIGGWVFFRHFSHVLSPQCQLFGIRLTLVIEMSFYCLLRSHAIVDEIVWAPNKTNRVLSVVIHPLGLQCAHKAHKENETKYTKRCKTKCKSQGLQWVPGNEIPVDEAHSTWTCPPTNGCVMERRPDPTEFLFKVHGLIPIVARSALGHYGLHRFELFLCGHHDSRRS